MRTRTRTLGRTQVAMYLVINICCVHCLLSNNRAGLDGFYKRDKTGRYSYFPFPADGRAPSGLPQSDVEMLALSIKLHPALTEVDLGGNCIKAKG